MAADRNNFILSLAAAIAADAGLALGGQLFAFELVEPAAPTDSDPPRSVLRPYPGSPENNFDGVPQIALQVMTVGMSARATMEQAYAIYNALHDGAGRPRCHWTFAGKAIVAGGVTDDQTSWHVRNISFLQTPGFVGRDERGRWSVPFNIDIRFKEIPLQEA
jgi:hypothetical protein